MGKLYIYCDESDDKGINYSNFFGGVLIRGEHKEEVLEILKNFKSDSGLIEEIKWSKINQSIYERYIEFLDLVFDFVEQDKLKVRIFFSENKRVPPSVANFEPQSKYLKLYYQFIKHAFGLKYCNGVDSEPMELFIALDELPVKNAQKQVFREYISGIVTQADFAEANLRIQKSNISEYVSKNEIFGQVIDLVLGGIQFRLNDKHLYREIGKRAIPTKTKAKYAVYQHINRRLQRIRPNFNIGISTGQDSDYKNKWHHSYRHWNFKANVRNYQVFMAEQD